MTVEKYSWLLSDLNTGLAIFNETATECGNAFSTFSQQQNVLLAPFDILLKPFIFLNK